MNKAITIYHVLQNETLWRVNTEGPDRGLSSFNQKFEAVNYAKQLAQANRPSKIVVHGRATKIESEFSYAEAEPPAIKAI